MIDHLEGYCDGHQRGALDRKEMLTREARE
jgi:hypothetical protein